MQGVRSVHHVLHILWCSFKLSNAFHGENAVVLADNPRGRMTPPVLGATRLLEELHLQRIAAAHPLCRVHKPGARAQLATLCFLRSLPAGHQLRLTQTVLISVARRRWMQVENEAKIMIAIGIIGDQSPFLMDVVGPLFLEVPPIKVWGSGLWSEASLVSQRLCSLEWTGEILFAMSNSK